MLTMLTMLEFPTKWNFELSSLIHTFAQNNDDHGKETTDRIS